MFRSTTCTFCGTRYIHPIAALYPLRFTIVGYDFLQPTLVSNSNISLKISTFASRDIVGHVADRLAI